MNKRDLKFQMKAVSLMNEAITNSDDGSVQGTQNSSDLSEEEE